MLSLANKIEQVFTCCPADCREALTSLSVKDEGFILNRSAGYVSTKKDGSERLNFTAFYEALLEAKGVTLGDGGGSGG
jgi:hypothetical protein